MVHVIYLHLDSAWRSHQNKQVYVLSSGSWDKHDFYSQQWFTVTWKHVHLGQSRKKSVSCFYSILSVVCVPWLSMFNDVAQICQNLTTVGWYYDGEVITDKNTENPEISSLASMNYDICRL